MENFGDVPFCQGAVASRDVAALAVAGAGCAIGGRCSNRFFKVLRNDGHSGLPLCAACGGDFVRINVLSGAMVTDQGVIKGSAFSVMRLRRQLAPTAKLLADVHVKHASPLGNVPIEVAARDTVERGLADALVVSGPRTGEAADLDSLKRVRSACPETPLLVGSGVTVANAASYLEYSDGFIVGTSVKRDGKVSNPIDRVRLAALKKTMQ